MSDTVVPKAVVFDLDYTLWPYWVDTHIDPPLKRKNDALNQVVDRGGQKLAFYKDVPSILLELKSRGIHVAAASRTCAPTIARQALRELLIDQGASKDAPPQLQQVSSPIDSSKDLFDQLEIYPGSKISHFQKIAKESGIDYCDMGKW